MSELALRIPGSTANLGPGFDTLALALGIYTDLTFSLSAERPGITLKGNLVGKLPTDENNLVFRVFKKIWAESPELLARLTITIDSQIPLSKGLGSSAAAVAGAVWAAHYLRFCKGSSMLPSGDSLLKDAFEFEGHADNLAASLYGGLNLVSQTTCPEGIITRQLVWPPAWIPILVIPPYELATSKARLVLPEMVALSAAVSNIQRTALLTHAVQTADREALKVALFDQLHEPYRQKLVPELGALKKHLHDSKALGITLSGAGSSVVVLAEEDDLQEVLDSVNTWAERQELSPEILALAADQNGIQQIQSSAGEKIG